MVDQKQGAVKHSPGLYSFLGNVTPFSLSQPCEGLHLWGRRLDSQLATPTPLGGPPAVLPRHGLHVFLTERGEPVGPGCAERKLVCVCRNAL